MSGLHCGCHVGITSPPDAWAPHPCEFQAGATSRVLAKLSSSFSAVRCGVFHSSPPSQVGKFTPMENGGRKTNLRGSGSGDTCLGPRTSHQVFLGLSLQSKRVGTVCPCESGALEMPSPHPGDMASVERPQSPDVSPWPWEGTEHSVWRGPGWWGGWELECSHWDFNCSPLTS